MRRALLDANLIVLLVVGHHDPMLVKDHKRTAVFAPEDVETLLEFLGGFGAVVTTPHALGEASNLLGQCSEPLRTQVFERLAAFVGTVIEVFIPSRDAVVSGCYSRLGLTDASLAQAAADGPVLVTVDLDLYLWLNTRVPEVYNFNHVRAGAWS